MRTNIYKEKILTVLKQHHLLSLADIHRMVRGADYSTVFRNVQQLIEAHIVNSVVFDRDTMLYELACSHCLHNHFVCTNCGEIDEIQLKKSPSIGNNGQKVTEILIRGLCAKCNK